MFIREENDKRVGCNNEEILSFVDLASSDANSHLRMSIIFIVGFLFDFLLQCHAVRRGGTSKSRVGRTNPMKISYRFHSLREI